MKKTNTRKRKRKREREKTPLKYVVTEGTRNSLASNRNKSKKDRKQLRNSRGRCDRMIGGQEGRKRHGEEVMREGCERKKERMASPDEDKGEPEGTTGGKG